MKKKLILILIISMFLISCNNEQNIDTEKITDRNEEKAAVEEIPNEDPQETEKPCTKPLFTEYFADPTKIQKVGQIGVVHGSGQFIVGRSYVSYKKEFEKIALYAPVNMILSTGALYQDPSSKEQEEYLPDYALNFNAGCNVEISYAHLKEVIPEIASQFGEPKADSRTEELDKIEFKAGDLIGYFIQNAGVAGTDFIVNDKDITNEFANQKRHTYGYGNNLLHVVCPYDYYEENKKQEYYNLLGGASGQLFENKNCGEINKDYPGTISGQWFLEKEITKSIYDYYMEGNYGNVLVIVGDEQRITIGKFNGRSQTWIQTNYPTYKAPKEIKDEHCYHIHHPRNNPSEWNGYIYFKLKDNETLNVFYSEEGDCPPNFPDSGYVTYYR